MDHVGLPRSNKRKELYFWNIHLYIICNRFIKLPQENTWISTPLPVDIIMKLIKPMGVAPAPDLATNPRAKGYQRPSILVTAAWNLPIDCRSTKCPRPWYHGTSRSQCVSGCQGDPPLPAKHVLFMEVLSVLQPCNARPMRSLPFFVPHGRSTNQRPHSEKAGVILKRESMWQWSYELMMDGMIMAKCFSARLSGWKTLFVTACHDLLHAESEMNLVTWLLRIRRNQSPGLSSQRFYCCWSPFKHDPGASKYGESLWWKHWNEACFSSPRNQLVPNQPDQLTGLLRATWSFQPASKSFGRMT